MGWPQYVVIVYYLFAIIIAFLQDGQRIQVRFSTTFFICATMLLVLYIGGFFS